MGKDFDAFIREQIGRLPEKQVTQIKDRLDEMPASLRPRYMKAMRGGAKNEAIAVFCFQCVGWVRADVALCRDLACPLYPYRPVQEGDE